MSPGTSSPPRPSNLTVAFGILLPIVSMGLLIFGPPAWQRYRARPHTAPLITPVLEPAGAPPPILLQWLAENDRFCGHVSRPRCSVTSGHLVQTVGPALPGLLAAEILRPSAARPVPCDSAHDPRRTCGAGLDGARRRRHVAARLLITLGRPGHEAATAIILRGDPEAVGAVTWPILYARGKHRRSLAPLTQLLLASRHPLVIAKAFLNLEEDSVRVPDRLATAAIIRAIVADPPRKRDPLSGKSTREIDDEYRAFATNIGFSRIISPGARRRALEALVDTFPIVLRVAEEDYQKGSYAGDWTYFNVTEGIVNLAGGLAMEKDIAALPVIRRATRLFPSPYDGFLTPDEFRALNLARQRLEDLRPWWYPIAATVRWAETHPMAWPLGIPASLALIWSVLLWVWPIGIFHASQRVRAFSGSPLQLGITTISPAAFTLVPLFDRRKRVLDAWVQRYGAVYMRNLQQLPGIATTDTSYALPCRVDGGAPHPMNAAILGQAFRKSRTVVVISGEGGVGKRGIQGQGDSRSCL